MSSEVYEIRPLTKTQAEMARQSFADLQPGARLAMPQAAVRFNGGEAWAVDHADVLTERRARADAQQAIRQMGFHPARHA